MARSPEQAYVEVLTEVASIVPPVLAAAWRAALDEYNEDYPSGIPDVADFIGKVEEYAISLGTKVGASLEALVAPEPAEPESETAQAVPLDDIFGEGFEATLSRVLGNGADDR